MLAASRWAKHRHGIIMAIRKKAKKQTSARNLAEPHSEKPAHNQSTQSTLLQMKSEIRNVSEAKAALVSLLSDACRYWDLKKRNFNYEMNPESWRFCTAMSYMSFSAEVDIRALPVTPAGIEDFYLKVLDITHNADWGSDENWSSDTQERALNEIREIIIRGLPNATIEKYRQKITGRGDVRVFLSYSSKDRVAVEKFGDSLRRKGFHIWYDKHEIYIGDEIHSRISEGINQSQYFCVFLSKNSVDSKWVQDELRQAIERVHSFKAKVLPILLEDCEVPGHLRGINYGDLRDQLDEDSFNGIVEQVVNAIDKYLQSVKE